MKSVNTFAKIKKYFILIICGQLLLSCSPVKFTGGYVAKTPETDNPVQVDTTPTPAPVPPPNPEPNPTPMPVPTPGPMPTPTPTPVPTPVPTPTPVNTIDKRTDIVVQMNMNQVDILLVVDDSSSMEADNARLAQRMGGFIQSLHQANLDWQMCVTTTDYDYYEGTALVWSGTNTHLLTKTQLPQINQIVQQTIYDIGYGYSNDEQGIRASYGNILRNNIHNCHRPKAALALIIISDEDERSIGGFSSLSSAQYKSMLPENNPTNLVNLVKTTFGETKKFKTNSIVVPNTLCETQQDAEGSPSFVGMQYMVLSRLTEGSIGNICDSDYTQNLTLFSEQIKNTVVSQKLSCSPVGPVTVTGQPVSTTYSVSGDMINFTPALIEGSTVTVIYKCAK